MQGLSEAISDPELAEPGRTSSVLLFTDGLANRGLTDSAKAAECMKGALEDCRSELISPPVRLKYSPFVSPSVLSVS